jgi:hypothetical protein
VRPRARERGRAAAVVALVLVVAAAAGAYLLTRRGAPPATGLAADAARMAPESTQVLVAVDLAKIGIDEADRKGVVGALRQLEGIDKLDATLQQELGLTLDELLATVEPAGVLALAPREGKTSVVDPHPREGQPPVWGFVALRVKDEAKAAETLGRLQEKSAVKYKTETHGGAKVNVPETADKGPSWAIHEKHLIAGVRPEDVKAAVDGLDGRGRSLADAPRFREGLARVKHTDALVAYVDLQGLLSAVPLAEPGLPGEVKQLVQGLRVMAAGFGPDGRDLVSEFVFTVDPKAGGPIVGDVFKPSFGMDVKTLDLFPADTESYGAINAKMIWQIVYDVLGRFPQTRGARETPAEMLKAQGIDLQADILDAVTGEIAYVLPDYGRLAASTMPAPGEHTPTPNPFELFQNVRVVVAVPLARKDRIETLLGKFIPEPVRESLTRADHQGTSVYSTPDGMLAYAFVDDHLVAAFQDGAEQIKKLIDARRSGKTLRSRPGYDRLIALAGGAKPILLGYADARKVYGGMADALEAAQPGLAKLVRLFARGESAWQAWVLQPDALYAVSVSTGVVAGPP